jgi:hypothetical protein
MKAASRLALDERRARAMDFRAAAADKDGFAKYMAQLMVKTES